MVNINKRLLMCADLIGNDSVLCDVGTDHGYLCAFTVSTGKCKKAYALDKNEGPLGAARNTIIANNLEDKIELVLSDGLKNVDVSDVTDIVIAGMGGELIAKILGDTPLENKNINFVLQPMTKPEILRKWLYANGYNILCEKNVTDDSFVYTVMQVCFTGKKIIVSDFFAYTGKVDSSSSDGRKYLINVASKVFNISKGLKKSNENAYKASKFDDLFNEINNMLGE